MSGPKPPPPPPLPPVVSVRTERRDGRTFTVSVLAPVSARVPCPADVQLALNLDTRHDRDRRRPA